MIPKCSPDEMRFNLKCVKALELSGINFVAVPVRSQDEKEYFLRMAGNKLKVILEEIEEDTKKLDAFIASNHEVH